MTNAIQSPNQLSNRLENFNHTGELNYQTKQYAKGAFIYFPADNTEKTFLVSKGRVKTGAYSPDGREIIKGILHEHDLFGETGLIGQTQRGEFAQTMMVTEVMVFNTQDIQKLMKRDPSFGFQIVTMMGAKLQNAQRRLESQVFRKARERIIEFLRDLGRDKGQRVGFELLVRNFFTHQEIAGLTGTSRQTVTTILNELKTDNVIYFNRRRLLIRDLNQLTKMIA